jgi:hypothetical protein
MQSRKRSSIRMTGRGGNATLRVSRNSMYAATKQKAKREKRL